MFRIGNVLRITKYLLLSAWTLSSDCLAAVDRDDNIHYVTTRRPIVWELFTVPTYEPAFSDNPPDVDDRTVFFVVLSLSIVFIGLLVYICQKNNSSSTERSSTSGHRVPGAVIHPPPRHLSPSSVNPTAPVLGRSSDNARPMMVSFINTGYQSDSAVDGRRSSDGPPDYAAVTIGDLTTPERSKFPTVIPRMETPPPKYQDGQPFS